MILTIIIRRPMVRSRDWKGGGKACRKPELRDGQMREGVVGQIDTSVETMRGVAVLSTAESEEAFPLDSVVLPMVVEVHLHI